MGEWVSEPICFEGMIKDVKSSRRVSGDLEATLILTFRPLDEGNSEAIRLLAERQKLEREVKVVVTG